MSGGGGLLANLLDKKKNAFTLAETLIALGVIGIIAALTIP
ncbi:type II secretion system protein [bacterium]|nr:type II secretion system protein [bacterium]